MYTVCAYQRTKLSVFLNHLRFDFFRQCLHRTKSPCACLEWPSNRPEGTAGPCFSSVGATGCDAMGAALVGAFFMRVSGMELRSPHLQKKFFSS